MIAKPVPGGCVICDEILQSNIVMPYRVTVVDLLMAVYARRDPSTIASGTKSFGAHAGGRKLPPVCRVDLVFLHGAFDGAFEDQKEFKEVNRLVI